MTISITCPNGHGETDRRRCLDRATPPRAMRQCSVCLIPARLIARGGVDPLNRRLAAGLVGLISSPWTPPAQKPAAAAQPKAKPAPKPAKPAVRQPPRHGSIPRHRALAMALAAALQTCRGGVVPETALARRSNAIKPAPALKGDSDILRVVRQAGLPVQRLSANRLVVPVNDRVKAFIRCYIKEAA